MKQNENIRKSSAVQNRERIVASKGSDGGVKRRFWPVVFRTVVPIVITVGLCYVLFARQDMGEMMRIIRTECNYWWIVLALALSILSHVLRGMRWRLQLQAIGVKAPLFVVVLSIFGTYAVNLVFPRLGELWRTGYISQRENAPFDGVFGSMVADRLADTVTVGLLTLLTFLFAGGPLMEFLSQKADRNLFESVQAVVSGPWLYVGIMATGLILWWIFKRFGETRFVGKVKNFCRGLWRGFAALAVMPRRGLWLLLTIGIWGCYFLQLYVAFFSFPATAEVVARSGVGAVMVCFVLSSISMVVPSNGGIGPWQLAIMFGLSLYASGVPALTESYSATFANLVMGSQTVLLIFLGLFTFICIAVDRRRKKGKTHV